MEDGSQRPIEDVKLCDRVLTAEGNIGTVVRTIVRRESTRVLRLLLRGHRHLRMTDEHPVLTQRGYVKAIDLTLGDWVAIPRYAPQNNEWIATSEHIPARTRLQTCRSVQTYGIPGKAVRTVVRNCVPDVIHLTPGVGRIIGLFLAEGNTDYSKVNWTFGSHEKDTLASELVELLKSEFGAEAAVRVRQSKAVVSLYGVQWARLFESLCATGSGRVRLHQQLASGPREFLNAVFRAWMDGDHVDATSGVTISHDLALNMFDIANMLGVRPGIDVVLRPGRGPFVDPAVAEVRLRVMVAVLARVRRLVREVLEESHGPAAPSQVMIPSITPNPTRQAWFRSTTTRGMRSSKPATVLCRAVRLLSVSLRLYRSIGVRPTRFFIVSVTPVVA
jgi:hypothetical protein